jgi:signal transduction histidine kinase
VDFYLTTQLGLQNSFEEMFIYDLNGEIRASTNQDQEGRFVNELPFFRPGLTDRYTQAPYHDPDYNRLSMVVSQPIRDNAGEIVGVFVGRLSLESLSDVMTTRVGLGDTGETYLVSTEGGVLVTPSRFQEGVGISLTSTGIDRSLNGRNGSDIYPNYRSQQVIGVYRWIPAMQSGMLAEIEEAEALSAVHEVREISLLVTIAAAVLAVVIASIGTIWITRPIRKLTEVATEVINGDYSRRAQIRRSNEIGQLATAFNTMTDNLVNTLDERNKRLDEIREVNRQLRIATAMAKEAARIKSEFLATVSHELRTPLNAIIGFSDMLLLGMSGELNEKQRHQVTRLQENGKRLLSLINNILDITRIEAGRTELAFSPFEPRQLANRLYNQMEVLAQQGGLKLEMNVDPALPDQLIGDENRIEQIVVNLLSNAFKFTEKGFVRLDIKANPEKSEWTLEVTDTGIGIPPHALDYIFEEFRQVDGSSTRVYKGSGLGLTITRNLVRLMDGRINVKSKLGGGSVFTVTLPMLESTSAVDISLAEQIEA